LRRWWPPAALSKAPQTNRSTSCAWSPPTPEDVPPVLRQLRGAP
jgi:hypothetical protein